MRFHSTFDAIVLLASFSLLSTGLSAGQAITPVCNPSVTPPIIVATHEQIVEAGTIAEPPLINTGGFGFAWPDTQIGVIKTSNGYEFLTSDGAFHPRQFWQGHWVGNNNYGSVTTTVGTLDSPLGTGAPQDVTISPNPDPAVNPNYSSYGYIGGGSVYQVPAGMTGAGNLLVTYHAELPNYALLGLAESTDNGLRWTDLGEIIRPNQAWVPGLTFTEIGDGHLVLSPDGKYFYLYFPDLQANTNANTHVSVARALAASLLDAAFGSGHPHAVPFEKFYHGDWRLQPGIGGASTDLSPNWLPQYEGYLDVHYNSALQRYVMITDDDTTFAYSESVDGLNWTSPISLGTYADGVKTLAPYPTSVGLGDDPSVLGKSFYVYYTFLHEENGGLPREGNSLRRFSLSCP
ncbi:MAG: hypothetical protein WAM89_16655 [Terriglobales bacterium]